MSILSGQMEQTGSISLARKRYSACLLMAGVVTFVMLAAAYLPTGIDWHQAFYPASRAVLHGDNPYEAAPEFNLPSWALVPLLPFAPFPEAVGRGALFVAALAVLAGTAYRFGASPVAVGMFLVSPPVLALLLTPAARVVMLIYGW